MSVYTDQQLKTNLVDSDTGERITIDLSKKTLPERYQLKKIQDMAKAAADRHNKTEERWQKE